MAKGDPVCDFLKRQSIMPNRGKTPAVSQLWTRGSKEYPPVWKGQRKRSYPVRFRCPSVI